MAVTILFSSDVAGGTQWSRLLRKTVRATLKAASFGQACEVSVRLTNDEVIRYLNREYRHIDAATDVLSFSMLEGEPAPTDGAPLLIGDIVISLETAQRRAAAQGWPLDAEMALLTAHGVLHLLGYDHQSQAPRQRMRAKENDALVRAGFDPTVVGR